MGSISSQVPFDYGLLGGFDLVSRVFVLYVGLGRTNGVRTVKRLFKREVWSTLQDRHPSVLGLGWTEVVTPQW